MNHPRRGLARFQTDAARAGSSAVVLVACLLATLAAPFVTPVLAEGTVGMKLEPSQAEVNVGDTFAVDVRVTIGGGEAVNWAEFHLDFDPGKLAVEDGGLTAGATFPVLLQAGFDNDAGTVDLCAGAALGGPAQTSDFVLATILFRAGEETDGTRLEFVYQAPMRQTQVFAGAAEPVLDRTAVVDGDVVVHAGEREQCELTVDARPPEGGSATYAHGNGTYPCGTSVSIIASAGSGYHFEGWSGGVADPASAATVVELDASKTVIARFERDGSGGGAGDGAAASPTLLATASPTPTPTVLPTSTQVTASPGPSGTPAASPSPTGATVSPAPAATPRPTVSPIAQPTPAPTTTDSSRANVWVILGPILGILALGGLLYYLMTR